MFHIQHPVGMNDMLEGRMSRNGCFTLSSGEIIML